MADDQNLRQPQFLVSTHVIGRRSFKNKEKKINAYEKSSIHGGLVYGINTAIISFRRETIMAAVTSPDNQLCQRYPHGLIIRIP